MFFYWIPVLFFQAVSTNVFLATGKHCYLGSCWFFQIFGHAAVASFSIETVHAFGLTNAYHGNWYIFFFNFQCADVVIFVPTRIYSTQLFAPCDSHSFVFHRLLCSVCEALCVHCSTSALVVFVHRCRPYVWHCLMLLVCHLVTSCVVMPPAISCILLAIMFGAMPLFSVFVVVLFATTCVALPFAIPRSTLSDIVCFNASCPWYSLVLLLATTCVALSPAMFCSFLATTCVAIPSAIFQYS